MKNKALETAAYILREIVSRVIGGDPWEVKLSGELQKNFQVVACSTSGSMYNDRQDVSGWAFYPDKGLVEMAAKSFPNHASNANGTWQAGWGFDYEQIARNHPDALFVVIQFKKDYSDNCRTEEYVDTTLYKTTHLDRYMVEKFEDDLERWTEWLRPPME